MIETSLKATLTAPCFLVVWGLLVAVSLAALIYDLRRKNAQTPSLMQVVWIFTVLYSGPLGLAVYFYSGRRQIARDSLWRRAFRSVAHCYSGCGGGEIVGVFIAACLSLGLIAAYPVNVLLIAWGVKEGMHGPREAHA